MNPMIRLARWAQTQLDKSKGLDFLALLGLRLYLAPIFWVAGVMKLHHFDDTVAWFREDLGLPLPWVMAAMATAAEIFGG